MDGDAADALVEELDLAGVHAGADVEAERGEVVDDFSRSDERLLVADPGEVVPAGEEHELGLRNALGDPGRLRRTVDVGAALRQARVLANEHERRHAHVREHGPDVHERAHPAVGAHRRGARGCTQHTGGPLDHPLVAGRGGRKSREPLGRELARPPHPPGVLAPRLELLRGRPPGVVVRAQPALRARAVEDEGRRLLGVGGGEQRRDRRSVALPEDRRALDPEVLQHRADVVDPLLGRRQVVGLDAIGEPEPAPVEDDQPREARKPAQEPPDGRFVPVEVELRDPAGDEDEVGAFADGLVGDPEVAARRVVGLGSVRGRTKATRGYACGIRASSASPSVSRTGSSSMRSRMSWKKPRTIRRSASARERPRAIR